MANDFITFRDVNDQSQVRVLAKQIGSDAEGDIHALTVAFAEGTDSSDVTPQTEAFQEVTTTVLRIGGASSWTGASTNGASKRLIDITNLSSAYTAYLTLITNAASTVGAVSSTRYAFKLGPGEAVLRYEIPAGYDLAVVRATGGSGEMRMQEFLF